VPDGPPTFATDEAAYRRQDGRNVITIVKVAPGPSGDRWTRELR